jgi:hypothetical protein
VATRQYFAWRAAGGHIDESLKQEGADEKPRQLTQF